MGVTGTPMRRRVARRDNGVCAACGVDAEKLRETAQSMVYAKRGELLEPLGYAPGYYRRRKIRSLWETDHIVSPRDGGNDDMANLRTLCVPCHQREGKRRGQLHRTHSRLVDIERDATWEYDRASTAERRAKVLAELEMLAMSGTETT